VKAALCILILLAVTPGAFGGGEARVVWSDDGAWVAWSEGAVVGYVKVFEQTHKPIVLPADRMEVAALFWGNDQGFLALCVGQGRAELFAQRPADAKARSLRSVEGITAIAGAGFHKPTAKLRFFGSMGAKAVLVTLSLKQTATVQTRELGFAVDRLALSDDGQWIAVATEKGTLISGTEGELNFRPLSPSPFVHAGQENAVVWRPDGGAVALLARRPDGQQEAEVLALPNGPSLGRIPAVHLAGFNRRGYTLTVMQQRGQADDLAGLFDPIAKTFIPLGQGKFSGAAYAFGNSVAVIWRDGDRRLGFSRNHLVVFRAGQILPFRAARGAVCASWSPDGSNIAFVCVSRTRRSRHGVVLGVAYGHKQWSSEFFAVNREGEIASADMLYLTGLHHSAAVSYEKIFRASEAEKRDVDFALITRLLVSRSRDPRQNVEPLRRRLYEALRYNPSLIEDVACAFMALEANEDGVDLLLRFAGFHRDNPLAVSAFVAALKLAEDARLDRLARKIVFRQGISIYSNLLSTGHPRVRYEPYFFDVLARLVAQQAPGQGGSTGGYVDVLAFVRDVLKGFPRAALKDGELTKLHLIAARTRRYRGHVKHALKSYIDALKAAPPGTDTTAIWRETFETEAQFAGIDLPQAP